MSLNGATTILHSFPASGGLGVPQGRLLEVGGLLYGVASGGAFSIDAAGSIATLHTFVNADGTSPKGGLTQATDGMLYGTMYRGGLGCGLVYKLDLSGTLTPFYQFPFSNSLGCFNGNGPNAGVIQASDGNLYGATDGFFSGVYGNVYTLTLGGGFSLVHGFSGSDGGKPVASLSQDSNGNIVGTTSMGTAAPNANGTVFSIASGGAFSTLVGLILRRRLRAASRAHSGSVWNLLRDRVAGRVQRCRHDLQVRSLHGVTVLRHLSQDPDGDSNDPLLSAADGDFYGTTSAGGGAGIGNGTLFKVTPDGVFTRLYTFTSPSTTGVSPESGLIQTSDGSLYGTTNSGGAGGAGTIFRRDPSGNASTLHALTAPEGQGPAGTLIQGLDGRLTVRRRTEGRDSGRCSPWTR